MAKKKLQTHPLIKKLGVDPTKPPDRVALVSYLGPAGREGHWRIYHDLSFGLYTEVPEDAILSSEPMDPGNENSPSLVVVKAGVPVQTMHAISHSTGAAFLQGSIADANLLRSPAAQALVGGTSVVNSFCC